MHASHNLRAYFLTSILVLLITACQSIELEPLNRTTILSPLQTPNAAIEPTAIKPAVTELKVEDTAFSAERKIYFADEADQTLSSYQMATRYEQIELRDGEPLSSTVLEYRTGYLARDGNALPDKYYDVNKYADVKDTTSEFSVYFIGDQIIGFSPDVISSGEEWMARTRDPETESFIANIAPLDAFVITPSKLHSYLLNSSSEPAIEIVNGIETVHYHIVAAGEEAAALTTDNKAAYLYTDEPDFSYDQLSPTPFTLLLVAFGGLLEFSSHEAPTELETGIEYAQIDLWVSTADSLIVKYVVQLSYTNPQSTEAQQGLQSVSADSFITRRSYDLLTINTDFVIEIPPEAIGATSY